MNLPVLFRASLGAAAVTALSLAPASAQQAGTIEGRVVEAATQRPMANVYVQLVESGIATLTDNEGRYRFLSVPQGRVTIRARFMGYGRNERAVEVAPGATVTADFALAASALALDEVVVTGTGRPVEQRRLASPVATISAEEIAGSPAISVADLLQGRVPGAQVSATSAQAGTGALVTFRGIKSVNASQQPVIYIDGVRVDNDDNIGAGTGGEFSSALAELVTSDIDRIEVTKGGAASTLYGADAASGVIQIFTKRGTAGASRIMFRMEQGVDQPELKYMLDVGNIFPNEVDMGRAEPDFMRRHFFQTGHFQNYYVGVSGGETGLTYNLSGRIQQSEGVQRKNNSELFNLRGAVQARVNDQLTVDFTGMYTRNNFERLFNGTAIADPLTTFEVGDALFFSGASTLQEALDIFLMPDITEGVNRFTFSAGAHYRPTPSLSTRLMIGLDNRGNQQRVLEPIGFTPGTLTEGEPRGALTRWQRDFTSVSLDFAGTLSHRVSERVTSDFTLGVQGFRNEESIVIADAQGFALPGAPDVDQAQVITAFEANTELFKGGVYVQEEVGLADRLFLTGGLRFDASTTFGDDVGLQAFPKLGLAYVVSDEGFFGNALGRWVDELKLRVAYGQTGTQPQPFDRDLTFAAISFRGESAPTFDNPGNDDLKAEVTSTVEAGFDVALLNNRLGLNFTYFDAKTTDAMLAVPEQPATGQGTQIRNIGEIVNRGVEVEANVLVLSRSNLQWSIGASFATLHNEVTDMGGAAPFLVTTQQRVEEGRPVGAWFVTTPFDSNGDGFPDASRPEYTGKSPIPTRTGSVRSTLTLWNRLNVTALADWATGFEVMDWGSVWATFNGIYRSEIIDSTKYRFPIIYDLSGNPILDDDGNPVRYAQSQARSAFIWDGDYLKLREISVNYTLPTDVAARLRAARANVYASIRNVAIFSKNPLIDPELNGVRAPGQLALGGESSITLSPPRMFRLGVELTF